MLTLLTRFSSLCHWEPTVLSSPACSSFYSSFTIPSPFSLPPRLLYLPPSSGHLSCCGPGFLWLNIALNRCSALERNTLPLLGLPLVCVPVCACLCVCLRVCLCVAFSCDFFFHNNFPNMLCWFWLSSKTVENWVRTGTKQANMYLFCVCLTFKIRVAEVFAWFFIMF